MRLSLTTPETGSSWIKLILATAVMVATGLASAQTVREQQERPPPLEPRAGCDLFRGPGSGNDPTYQVEMLICVDGAAVTGTFQSSSLVSGWSKRALDGRATNDGRTLHLRDLRYIDNRPAPSWEFCLVDSYTLERREGVGLRGTYHAENCDDGELNLTWVEQVRPDDEFVPRSLPPPPSPPSRSTCDCSTPGVIRFHAAVLGRLLLR